jgi:hypothetical protein
MPMPLRMDMRAANSWSRKAEVSMAITGEWTGVVRPALSREPVFTYYYSPANEGRSVRFQ